MIWQLLFSGYASRDGIAEVVRRYYLHHPQKLTSPQQTAAEDAQAERAIRELTGTIEQIKSYRGALQQRYAQLVTMDSQLIIRLERSASCGIYYYLSTRRRYEDGTEDQLTSKRYPGKERRQAIKDFEALCTANPAAIQEKRIEKASWER